MTVGPGQTAVHQALVLAFREHPDFRKLATEMAVHECAHLAAIVALYGPGAVRFLELETRDDGASLNGRNRIKRPPVRLGPHWPRQAGEALIALAGDAAERAFHGQVTNDAPSDRCAAQAIAARLALRGLRHAPLGPVMAKDPTSFARLLASLPPAARPAFAAETARLLEALEAAAADFVRQNRPWIEKAAARLVETAYLDPAAIRALRSQRPLVWLDGSPIPVGGIELARRDASWERYLRLAS